MRVFPQTYGLQIKVYFQSTFSAPQDDLMQLTTDEFEAVDAVTSDVLREILESDVFGKFAVLAETEAAFIQAACAWEPTEECRQFLRQYDSDPWLLEYHDGETDMHYRARGYFTLSAVIEIFTHYLEHDDSWRRNVDWRATSL